MLWPLGVDTAGRACLAPVPKGESVKSADVWNLGKSFEPQRGWFRHIRQVGDSGTPAPAGGGANGPRSKLSTRGGGHASTPLFQFCRGNAPCAAVCRVMVFSGGGNNQPQRRGEAGHSNRFGQGGPPAGRLRYSPADRCHSCIGPRCCIGPSCWAASASVSR
jgi:hypothetical protein